MKHNHSHSCTCDHVSVKFCKHCQTVYCEGCNQEWTAQTSWKYTYTYPGMTTYPNQWYNPLLTGNTGGTLYSAKDRPQGFAEQYSSQAGTNPPTTQHAEPKCKHVRA